MLADCNLVFTILFTIECVMKLGSFGYKVGNSEYRLNDITMACCEWRRFGRLVIFRLMAIQTSFLLDKARDRVCVRILSHTNYLFKIHKKRVDNVKFKKNLPVFYLVKIYQIVE